MEKFWQKNKDLKKESGMPLLASQDNWAMNWACCAWCTWVKVGDTKEVSEEALGRHVRRCSGKPKSRVGTRAEQAVEHMYDAGGASINASGFSAEGRDGWRNPLQSPHLQIPRPSHLRPRVHGS